MTHCNTLQHTATQTATRHSALPAANHCRNTLQHNATQYNTLQDTLQHTIPHYRRIPRRDSTTTHCCNTLMQHTTPHILQTQFYAIGAFHVEATLQLTVATQHTTTHCCKTQRNSHCNTHHSALPAHSMLRQHCNIASTLTIHYNTLQHTLQYTLQHNILRCRRIPRRGNTTIHCCNTLQHTATHTATHHSALPARSKQRPGWEASASASEKKILKVNSIVI